MQAMCAGTDTMTDDTPMDLTPEERARVEARYVVEALAKALNCFGAAGGEVGMEEFKRGGWEFFRRRPHPLRRQVRHDVLRMSARATPGSAPG